MFVCVCDLTVEARVPVAPDLEVRLVSGPGHGVGGGVGDAPRPAQPAQPPSCRQVQPVQLLSTLPARQNNAHN